MTERHDYTLSLTKEEANALDRWTDALPGPPLTPSEQRIYERLKEIARSVPDDLPQPRRMWLYMNDLVKPVDAVPSRFYPGRYTARHVGYHWDIEVNDRAGLFTPGDGYLFEHEHEALTAHLKDKSDELRAVQSNIRDIERRLRQLRGDPEPEEDDEELA